MFCTYCGAQNPDDYRFCGSCGKQRPSLGQTASPLNPPTQPQLHGLIRRLFLAASQESEKKNVNNPFTLLDDNVLEKISSVGSNEFSKTQIDELVWPHTFPEADKQLCEDGMVYVTYLQMLSAFADMIGSIALMQGAFWGKTLVLYNSQLKSLADDRKWRDYDEFTTQYLGEARETRAAMCIIRPLVKSAHAKIMLGDRKTARQYLDEFDRIVRTAGQETAAYQYPDNKGLYKGWIEACQKEASELRTKL